MLLYLLAGANIKLICNLARKKLTIFKVYFEIKIIETKLEKYLKTTSMNAANKHSFPLAGANIQHLFKDTTIF